MAVRLWRERILLNLVDQKSNWNNLHNDEILSLEALA